MSAVDSARQAAVLVAERCGHPDHLAHHPCRAHHADSSERHVRAADVTPRHEEVADIAGVEATVRHRVGINPVMHGRGLELSTGKVP